MSKILAIFILLSLFAISSTKDCFGEECQYNGKVEVEKEEEEEIGIADIVPIINKEVRRVYWYYLRKAHLIFQANLDISAKRVVSFFIYRNIVGTFLVITTFDAEIKQSQISTFVRLGNGYEKDIETPYSPVNVQPFIISLRLAHGEFLIEMDEDGNFKVNGDIINTEEEKEDLKVVDVDVKTKMVDEHVRKTYWYYLLRANLIHVESIRTTERIYVVLTYVNIVGTFLVIGSCNADDVVQVNTFVRLGAGAKQVTEVKPIEIKPAIIEVSEY